MIPLELYDGVDMTKERAKNLENAMKLLFGDQLLPITQPVRPAIKLPIKREAEFELDFLGAKWNCEVEFTLFDEDLDEGAVSVLEIAIEGKMIDFEELTCLAQDQVYAACVTAAREKDGG